MGKGLQPPRIKNSENSMVVVAVEAGKNSQHALKWAADHLHVCHKITTVPTPSQQFSISEVYEDVASAFLEQPSNRPTD